MQSILASESLKVVVSITPLHALVSGVMQGVANPLLIVKEGASPHDYSLRPSEIKQLQNADIIFWAGPDLETFLIKPLQNIPAKTRLVEFMKTPNLFLLPIRHSANWEEHAHASHDTHSDHHTHEGLTDPHFWLDPNNAARLLDLISKNLSDIDPIHQQQYQENSNRLKTQLLALDKKLKIKLQPIQTIPFIVFHDAYQYFEHHYGLKGVGSITLHPELPPSANRIQQLQATIRRTHAACIFSEPQFQPKLVDSLAKDLHIKTGILDPLGPKTRQGAEGYFELLEQLSESLSSCLGNP
jgi:zinc transport system substrate-binding protein